MISIANRQAARYRPLFGGVATDFASSGLAIDVRQLGYRRGHCVPQASRPLRLISARD
jgi:hypothetical protein